MLFQLNLGRDSSFCFLFLSRPFASVSLPFLRRKQFIVDGNTRPLAFLSLAQCPLTPPFSFGG